MVNMNYNFVHATASSFILGCLSSLTADHMDLPYPAFNDSRNTPPSIRIIPEIHHNVIYDKIIQISTIRLPSIRSTHSLCTSPVKTNTRVKP